MIKVMGSTYMRRVVSGSIAFTLLLSLFVHDFELRHDHHHLVPDHDQITAALHGNERKFFVIPERFLSDSEAVSTFLIEVSIFVAIIGTRRIGFSHREHDYHSDLFRAGTLNTKEH